MWNDLAQKPQQPQPQGGGAPPRPMPQGGPPPQAAPQGPPPGAPQGGQQQIPDYIAQNVDPNNPVAVALIERVEKLTPQDVQAFVGGIQPPAVAVLKKIIPEIGFLIDRAIQSAQGGAAAPSAAPAPGGAPPAPRPMPPQGGPAAPPPGGSGLRRVG